ncbi:hypothetical protein D1164_13975 [Mariniphaga sediminis]|uniref:Uncharacterized protein n=1 Tax=Mariniphaga sediminis TaxID=1628158 RepID=A0A399CXR5_9BACT|nr:hypothetical protein [Mariniphaga sediminis]RIH64464.1 hypothetical protein D1164_13975 [Mariniphaga sediminis]
MQIIDAQKDLYITGEPIFTIKEGRQLADAADDKNRIVQCDLSLRSNPSVLAAKTYIDGGKLGQGVHIKIYSLQKNADNLSNTSCSLDLARFSHRKPRASELCLWLPVRIRGKRRITSTGCHVKFKNFTIKCESGSACQYMLTSPASVKEENQILQWLLQAERIEIYGLEGLLHMDPFSRSWQVQGNAGKVQASMTGVPENALHIQNFIS